MFWKFWTLRVSEFQNSYIFEFLLNSVYTTKFWNLYVLVGLAGLCFMFVWIWYMLIICLILFHWNVSKSSKNDFTECNWKRSSNHWITFLLCSFNILSPFCNVYVLMWKCYKNLLDSFHISVWLVKIFC